MRVVVLLFPSSVWYADVAPIVPRVVFGLCLLRFDMFCCDWCSCASPSLFLLDCLASPVFVLWSYRIVIFFLFVSHVLLFLVVAVSSLCFRAAAAVFPLVSSAFLLMFCSGSAHFVAAVFGMSSSMRHHLPPPLLFFCYCIHSAPLSGLPASMHPRGATLPICSFFRHSIIFLLARICLYS